MAVEDLSDNGKFEVISFGTIHKRINKKYLCIFMGDGCFTLYMVRAGRY